MDINALQALVVDALEKLPADALTRLDEDLASLLASSIGPAGAKAARADGGGRAARESRQAAHDASGRVSASPAARKRAGELGIQPGSSYSFDVFHAERHLSASNFRIETSIECFTPVD